MAKKLLVVEDDPVTGALIQQTLQREGYTATLVDNGQTALEAFETEQPDLVVLDRMLPEMSGLEVCRKIRENSNVPIIILTQKSEIFEKVEGLDAGANDYLPKPFHIDEFLARIRVQLRQGATLKSERELDYADISLDIYSRKAYRQEHELNLTTKEFDLLLFFVNHAEEVLSKPRILKEVWDWNYDGEDNIIEVYIHNLRKKLQSQSTEKILHTIRGAGYMLKTGS